MDFAAAIATHPTAQLGDVKRLLSLLAIREQDAIWTESRIDESHWHQILDELAVFLPNASAVADDVRNAISTALETVLLAGPKPVPLASHCERAVSYEKAVLFYSRELGVSLENMQDHFDKWADPSNARALQACRNLLGAFLTGMKPTWAIPYDPSAPRPLDGCVAESCHCRLALHPVVDTSEKVIMTYRLPPGVVQSIPTLGDAFRWCDPQPHWRSFFLPADPGHTVGRTAPMFHGIDGFPEIVHDPVLLVHLTHPLEKRY
jgi:hypothetical protein